MRAGSRDSRVDDGHERESGYEARFADLAARSRRVAFRLLGDGDGADEVAQETMARAYLRWARVEPYAEAWVARVAANLALDEHRRRTRRRRHAEIRLVERDHSDRADGLVSRLELVAGLRALTRRQREVVVMRYLADLSEADTAAALGCAPGTVKQHAHRGLAALRLSVDGPSAARRADSDRSEAPAPDHSPMEATDV